MSTTEDKLMSCTVVAVTGVAVIATGAIVGGWAVSKMWLWFVVPTFNLPELSIPVALGLTFLVGYLTHQEIETKKKDDDTTFWVMFGLFSKAILRPLIFLGLAWIVRLFM